MWARDFETGNLPPVCAISGKPAQCWQKFGFRSTPRQAEIPVAAMHLLGSPLAALVEDLVALRAKGNLPLTRGMRRVVRIARLAPALLLVVGLVLTFSWDIWHSGTVEAIGFGLFVFAIPTGMVANWRIEPHGSLRRINGILILKLTNVHPNFAAAEAESLHHELEQGNWPPGFVGPGPVPLRFREPLVGLVQRIAKRDLRGLVDGGHELDSGDLEARLGEFSDRLIPLPDEVWQLAEGGKVVSEQGAWWVVLPLWTTDRGAGDLSLLVTIREKDHEVTFQVEDLEDVTLGGTLGGRLPIPSTE
jgi:hypothetical protein